MTEPVRYTSADGAFDLLLPHGWSAAPDPEQEGIAIAGPEEIGTLHVLAVPQDGFPDPAEELYAFLEEQGVELEEDEVEDVQLAGDGELALCEYVEEDEEEGNSFWLVAVATAPEILVFATYSCDEEDRTREQESVRQILSSLRLHEAP